MSKKTIAIIVVAALLLTAMVGFAAKGLLSGDGSREQTSDGQAVERTDEAQSQEEGAQLPLDQARESSYSDMVAQSAPEAAGVLAQILQGSDWVDSGRETVWIFDGATLTSQTTGSDPSSHEFMIHNARYSQSAPMSTGFQPIEAIVSIGESLYFLDLQENGEAEAGARENISRYTVLCDGIGDGELSEHRGVLVDVDFMSDETIANAVGDRQGEIEESILDWCELYAPLVTRVDWQGTSFTDWSMPATAIYFTFTQGGKTQELTVLFSDRTDEVLVQTGRVSTISDSAFYEQLMGISEGADTVGNPPAEETQTPAEETAPEQDAGQEGGQQ